jgi:hypothetical protein
MRHPELQRGMSIIGFLFVAAVLVVFAMVGFRLTPPYIEYYSVQRALAQSLDDNREVPSANEVRKSFQKYADSGYIESVRGADIEVQKTGNEVTAYVSWTRKLHMVGNVSLFLEFDAAATR